MSVTINVQDKNLYQKKEEATDFLKQEYAPKNNSYYSSEAPKATWEQKAQALGDILNVDGSNDSKLVCQCFRDLIEKSDGNKNNEGEMSRTQRVAELTSLMEKLSGSWNFNNNPHLFEEFKNDFTKMAENIPACEEAKAFFYASIKGMKLDSSKINIDPLRNLPSTNLNSQAFIAAREESKADDIMDNVINEKRTELSDEQLNLVAKHRMKRLLGYKELSPQTKTQIALRHSRSLTEQQSLKLMTEVLNSGQVSKEEIAQFVTRASSMRKVSKEMGAFVEALKPCTAIWAERYEKSKAKIQASEVAQKELQSAQIDKDNKDEALSALIQFENSLRDLNNVKNDKDAVLGKDEIAALAKNAVNGREPNKVVPPKHGFLKKMFMSGNEKRRQASLKERIEVVNEALSKMGQEKNAVILKNIASPLTSHDAVNEGFKILSEAKDHLKKAQEKRSDFPESDISYSKEQVQFMEKNNLTEKTAKLESDRNTQLDVLKQKARQTLAGSLGGQEFDGSSILAESEKLAKSAFKSKAEELRGKIKEASLKEMESRGVFEKPDIEKPNSTGTKISQESSSDVIQLMKDKKMYEKLSSEK